MNREKHVAREEVKNSERFKAMVADDRPLYEEAFESVIKMVNTNMKTFTNPYGFPWANSQHNIYHESTYSGWTNSFWTGLVWLCYEMTGNASYREYANKQIDTYYTDRLDQEINTDDHDIGFIYTLSTTAAYKLTGCEKAKSLSLRAARCLGNRFIEGAGIIQDHGSIHDETRRGHFIVDCSMNVPLLHFASRIEGNEDYARKAYTHMKQVADVSVKEDGSSYHVCRINDQGHFVEAKAGQGLSLDSCWARGQAWLIYGFALAYQHTGDAYFLEVAKKVTHYFLNRLPEDLICYWDLIYMSGDEPRDSSAASIAVCGLIELAGVLSDDDPCKELYERAADSILKSLIASYTTKSLEESNGLLQHAVYYRKGDKGVDECCIWGDYFYGEALVRRLKDWVGYW